MKKIFFYSLALGMMTLGLTSCNDDEDQLTDTRVTHFAELELLGDTWIEMNVGDTFKDPGYKATEGTEDITSKVVVTGSVNTAVGAFYDLVYSVSNKDGFAVSAARTVMVKDPQNFASAYYGESQYGSRHYYDAPITISSLGGNAYLISDLLGGFYAYGRYPQYLGSLDFLLEAVILLNDDNSISLQKYGDWYWGADVPTLLDGSYDPATGKIVLNMDFDAPFTVTLTK
jgi:hypothetical protein